MKHGNLELENLKQKKKLLKEKIEILTLQIQTSQKDNSKKIQQERSFYKNELDAVSRLMRLLNLSNDQNEALIW